LIFATNLNRQIAQYLSDPCAAHAEIFVTAKRRVRQMYFCLLSQLWVKLKSEEVSDNLLAPWRAKYGANALHISKHEETDKFVDDFELVLTHTYFLLATPD